MNAKTLDAVVAMIECEEAVSETVEVIVIEMIEDQDKIEDLMAVIAIEEDTWIEDLAPMIDIMIEDHNRIIKMVVIDQDPDLEMVA